MLVDSGGEIRKGRKVSWFICFSTPQLDREKMYERVLSTTKQVGMARQVQDKWDLTSYNALHRLP